MSSDIVLSASLRNNLLSLQNSQRLIDTTQLRLATGRKVSSALDDSQSFFTSQSLNNRASDLGRLLDGIGQSIRTIEEASNGVTALNNLVEQAQSIAVSARDQLAATSAEARATGDVDLRPLTNLVSLGGIGNNDIIRLITTDDSGNQIAQNITITTGQTASNLVENINNTFADNENSEISAEITDQGFLSIKSIDGRSFRITTVTGGTGISLTGFRNLGLDNYVQQESNASGNSLQAGTIIAGNTATSISLYESSGNVVEAADTLGNATYFDADGNEALRLANGARFRVRVDTDAGAFTSATQRGFNSFQDFVNSINNNANIGDLVEANFDSETGQLSLTALSDEVNTIQVFVRAGAATGTYNIGLGDPTGNLHPLNITSGGAHEDIISFNDSTQSLDQFASDYNDIRSQIDTLVQDANYRGINLLNGDSLVTFFNEDNTSSLITNGFDFTANGIGLAEATFRTDSEIALSTEQTLNALQSIRNFGASLTNNLSIIETRQISTLETVVTLRAGADDLSVADQNEEGANLLALQTRQALGVTSLSLASQSQQSVLRLF